MSTPLKHPMVGLRPGLSLPLLAQADGDHDVAVQKCKALAGDAQSRCRQQADANYDAAKANAKATEVSRTR